MKNKKCVVIAVLVGCGIFSAAAATVVIEANEVVKIGETAKVIAEGDDLVLRGTLDLNGNNLAVKSISCLTGEKLTVEGKEYTLASTVARITNSTAGTATFTVHGGATYFTGSVDSGVNFTCGSAQIFTANGAFAPAKFTVTTSTAIVISRPSAVFFDFKDVAAEDAADKYLRLSELMLTYDGVPILQYGRKTTVNTGSNRSAWYDMSMVNDQYWSSTETLSAAPARFSLTPSSSGCAAVNGYRITPSEEPAYAPKTWDVYMMRSDATGLVLADRRIDDPLNRPTINPAKGKDNWSHRLSQDFAFGNFPLGSPFGETTDIELAANSVLRVSSTKPFVVGAISGSGTIQIEDGTTIAPMSLTEWTGTFKTKDCDGVGREAKVRVGASEPWNPAFDNSDILLIGGENACLTLDGAGEARGVRLSDGVAPLGMTVAAGADGVRGLTTYGASYSGDTKVESGTLCVYGKRSEVTCRYIRLSPKEVPFAQNYYGYHWGLREFAVFGKNGNQVPLSGATVTNSNGNKWLSGNDGPKLIDGDVTTRVLPADGTGPDMTTVTIITSSPVTISSYDWYPAPDDYRFPLDMEIAVSNDGETWIVVDRRRVARPNNLAAWVGGASHFSFGQSVVLPTIPAELVGDSSAGKSIVGSIKARSIRFRPYETFFGGNFVGEWDYGWHVSEFSLLKDGKIVPWPAGTAVYYSGMSMGSAGSYGNNLANFANNIHTGGVGNVEDADRCFIDQCGGFVTVAAGDVVEFDAYELWNGSSTGTAVNRLPRVWSVEVSMDGSNWFVLDNHIASASDTCPGVYGEYGPFSVKNRWVVNTENNSIGDDSKVVVAEGAAVKFETPSEVIGGVSGLGSVCLADTRLGLNAVANPTFSGSVEGSGMLSLVDGVQFFDNADLKYTGELSFDGGAFGGTAAFGALKVSGSVRFALPDSVLENGGTVTMFTYNSIDAASRSLIEAATLVTPPPHRRKVSINVGETSATVTVTKFGLILVVR